MAAPSLEQRSKVHRQRNARVIRPKQIRIFGASTGVSRTIKKTGDSSGLCGIGGIGGEKEAELPVIMNKAVPEVY